MSLIRDDHDGEEEKSKDGARRTVHRIEFSKYDKYSDLVVVRLKLSAFYLLISIIRDDYDGI